VLLTRHRLREHGAAVVARCLEDQDRENKTVVLRAHQDRTVDSLPPPHHRPRPRVRLGVTTATSKAGDVLSFFLRSASEVDIAPHQGRREEGKAGGDRGDCATLGKKGKLAQWI
jgi:hypothetical protein